jgi:hypothetical protein
MKKQPKLIWEEPDWLKQANDWILTETARQGIKITGAIKQPHIYPWSTVLRVPTNEGTLFFKATAAETVYEAALTQKLVGWFPDCMPELLAVDTARGWMLMRDGGEPLRASIRPTQDIAPWRPVIARYAEVQTGLAEHITELLSLRIPDHRLSILPALFTQLLADEESLMIDQEKGLTLAEWQQLRGMTSRFEQICTDLADFGIPESLNHGDFHDGNVLLRDGRITFFDWGDASVTHPFFTLRTFFVSIENSLKLEDYSFTPEMAELLDLYLQPWQRFASGEALLSAYRLSKPVASIAKTLAWHQGITRMEGPLREEYAWIVPEILREFLYHEKMMSG